MNIGIEFFLFFFVCLLILRLVYPLTGEIMVVVFEGQS